MSAPVSISDTQLGLTQSELLLFRQHQQLIAQQPAQRGVMVERGRGTSRHSQPSSRAASAASSQSIPGRIVLDPRSLSNLSASLDNLLLSVQRRIQELEDATQQSVQASSNRSNNTIKTADDEITRMKKILREIDRLDEETEKIKHIREKVRLFRQRVDAASTRMDKIPPSHHHGRPSQADAARRDPRHR